MKNRIFVLLLMLLCIWMTVMASASIAFADSGYSVTRDEAIEWLETWGKKGDLGEGINLPATNYGYQCTDFVSGYMNWLVCGDAYNQIYVPYVPSAYPGVAENNPSRWEVRKNYTEFVPEPGDIFVSSAHVGVVVSSTQSKAWVVEQNTRDGWNDVTGTPPWYHEITWASNGNGPYGANYFIRFKQFVDNKNISFTFTKWEEKTMVGQTEAQVGTYVYPQGVPVGAITRIGCDLFNMSGTWLAGKSESPYVVGDHLTHYYPINDHPGNTEILYRLTPNTQYQYRYTVWIGETPYYSDYYTFVTQKPDPPAAPEIKSFRIEKTDDDVLFYYTSTPSAFNDDRTYEIGVFAGEGVEGTQLCGAGTRSSPVALSFLLGTKDFLPGTYTIEIVAVNAMYDNLKSAPYTATFSIEPRFIAEGICGENLRWSLDDKGTLRVDGSGEMFDYTYNEEPWEEYRGSINEVIVQEDVTSVGKYAFWNCHTLKSVTLSEGVTHIGDYAFSDCYLLSSITFPNSLTDIGSWAFKACFQLKAVRLYDKVSSIGEAAFGGCSALQTIEMDTSNPYYCVLDNVLFDKEKTTILVCATSKSGEYSIPSTVGAIGKWAFRDCTKLTSVIIPESVVSIDEWAFGYCSGLTSIAIPGSVESIGDSAFNHCSNLERVTLPNGIMRLGSWVFSSCGSLKSIVIPNSISRIDAYSFSDCDNLTDVYYDGTPDTWNMIRISEGNEPLANATIHFVSTQTVAIDERNFPDVAFRAYVSENCDLDHNGYLSQDEIEAVTSINTYQYSISSFAGIEFFTNLVKLSTGQQPQLIALDVSHNTKLKELHCENTGVTELDVSGATALESLSAYSSNLQRLNITQNHQLWRVDVGQNILTSLDLSGNPNLTWLGCEENQLSSLDISHNPQLSHLFCYSNNIAEIDITENPYLISIINNGTKTDNYGPNGDMVMYDQFSSETNRIKADKKTVFKFNNAVERTVVASGNCGDQGDNLTWVLYDDGELIISGSGAMADFYAEEYNYKGPWSRYYQDSILKVTIEDGVTNIGGLAFNYCTNLFSVTIPETVRSIDSQAFNQCYSLSNVNLPEGLASIGTSAFTYCESLKSIVIPASVTNIDFTTFWYCNNLVSISVVQNNNSYCDIDGVLFSKDQKNLLCYPAGRSGDYNIPNGVTEICRGAFADCEQLTSVTFPTSVMNVGEQAFSGCSSLSDITIPEGVTTLGSYSFYNCVNLKTVTLPLSLIVIGYNAFNTPDGVSMISDVYYNGTQSEWNSVYIHQGNNALLNANIHFNSHQGILASGECGAQGDNLAWVLYDDGELVISGTGAMTDYDYDSTNAWRPYKSSISSVVIENGATTIGKFAFHECASLTKVVIPESVRTIGHQAFWCCSGLTEVMIPEGVTMLGAQSFAECTGLSGVAIPSSVVEIRSSAFDECSGLMNIYVSSDNAVYCDIDGVLFNKDKTEIVTFPCGRSGAYDIPIIIPNGVTKIGDDAFASCKKITSITVPVGVTTIGERAFQGCLQLTDVSLPVGLKLIDSWGFSGCKSLKHIDLPDGVETIKWGAFHSCYNLESISLPASVKSIAESTFGNDSKLSDVYYGGTQDQWNLISIADYNNEPLNHATIHFAAIDLIEFVLPSSLSFIESEAFAGINAQVIVIPASVGAIESRAFADCPNLVMLYFEGSPNKIAKDAIDGCGTVTVSARQYSSAIVWASELGLPVTQHD